jgi:uroporphyrinogen III methyltransferase/synthase
VFESASAVTRFLAALTRGPRDLRALGRVQLCAVGPSTADRLAAAGMRPDVVVAEAGLDRVAGALEQFTPMDDQRILVVRPDHVHGSLAAELQHLGASVTDLVAYRTAPASPDSPGAQELYRLLLEGQIDAVTFTSPTALRRFAFLIGEEQAADLLNTTIVATIGPVTAAAATEMGIESPLVARTFTPQGLVDVLLERLGR